MTSLVLASSSPYRKSLLERLNLRFICVTPNIDETALADESAYDLAQRLAEEKASKILESHNNATVIGSDQVAVCGDRILGKPHTKENAIEQLTFCSGKIVTFYTGLCVLNTSRQFSTVSVYEVTFRELNPIEINRYIDIEQPLNCAGSFKTEGLGISLFKKQAGDDPSSLIGLPLIKTCEFLRALGHTIP